MTLLLGPPGSGKTTLLLALAGKLDKDLKVSTYFELLSPNPAKLPFLWIVVKTNAGNIRRLKYDLVIVQVLDFTWL